MRAGIWPGGGNRRRWSAPATNLLAATNGDGVEKIVGSFVIPANTLAVDGDVVGFRFVTAYLNNTGSNQIPQFALSINSNANLYTSKAAGSVVVTNGLWYFVDREIQIRRVSGSAVDIIEVISFAAGGASPTGVIGDVSFTNAAPRRQYHPSAAFAAASENTIKIRMLIPAFATPALHQIAGVCGYANLIG